LKTSNGGKGLAEKSEYRHIGGRGSKTAKKNVICYLNVPLFRKNVDGFYVKCMLTFWLECYYYFTIAWKIQLKIL